MEDTIYLEPDEEITSLIDKLKASKSTKVALVIPRQAAILQSVVNLKLLAKEATNLGKEISIVTADKIGRNLASQVGLAVYDSIRDRRPVYQPPALTPKNEEIIEINLAEEKEEEMEKPKGVEVHHFQTENMASMNSERRPPVTSFKKIIHRPPAVKKEYNWHKINKIVWPALGGLAIIFLVLGYLFLPKVKVILKVEALDFQKDETVTVSANVNQSDPDNKIFTGTLIDITKDKEKKFSASGKKNLGGKASGTLTLYNYWDSTAQGLNKGTKFSSSNKTFVSKGAVSIPGTSIRGGNIVPGTASVEIEAENPGEEYNVSAGRFTIMGLSSAQQEKIYGQSSKELTGGFSKEVTVVSENDFNKALETLTKEATDELQEELKAKAEGLEIYDKAVQNETVEKTSSAKIDDEANDFTLKIKQRLRVIVFNKENFNNFILSLLEKQIPYDKMISLGPDDSINATSVEPKYDQNNLNLNLHIMAKISSRVDLEKTKKDILGKNRAAAENYLNSLSGVTGYEIKYSPTFWLKHIPNFASLVTLELQYNNEVSPSPAFSPTLSPEVSP